MHGVPRTLKKLPSNPHHRSKYFDDNTTVFRTKTSTQSTGRPIVRPVQVVDNLMSAKAPYLAEVGPRDHFRKGPCIHHEVEQLTPDRQLQNKDNHLLLESVLLHVRQTLSSDECGRATCEQCARPLAGGNISASQSAPTPRLLRSYKQPNIFSHTPSCARKTTPANNV